MVRLVHDSLEFIVQLNEKQKERNGWLSNGLYREIMDIILYYG